MQTTKVATARGTARRRPRRPLRRGLLIAGVVVLVVTLATGAVLTVRGELPGVRSRQADPKVTIRRFAAAWKAGDYHAMYRQLTAASRRRTSFDGFVSAYRSTAGTASLLAVGQLGRETASGGTGLVTLRMRTRLFGTVVGGLELPLVLEDGSYRIDWSPRLTWPGLDRDERLRRVPHPPVKRGAILARDHTVLAKGPASAREYPQGTPFALITGFVKPPQTAADRHLRTKAGWPAQAPYGQGGLEQSLDRVLAGEPAISLVAAGPKGRRTVAQHAGRAPHNVLTTLDPDLQATATDLLGSQYGGIAVIDTLSGAVRAASGIAMDARQPPGSTFKVVTASAALAAGKVALDTYYPPAHYVQLGGFRLKNFRGELCGGTLLEAFAHSCNSVFAPVAIATGAENLVRMANRFGFNRSVPISYPLADSYVPPPSRLNNDVDLGVAGIGQAGVSATPLQMASVAQVIANGGVYRSPWLARRPQRSSDWRPPRRAVSATIASEVGEMMRAVVSFGTGTSASSSIATVNGKTGTAEIGPKVKSDAWFIGYAPAEAPRVAVAVLIVHGGVGGTIAAPLGRQALEAALAR
jgi:penicillin-binding protein A